MAIVATHYVKITKDNTESSQTYNVKVQKRRKLKILIT